MNNIDLIKKFTFFSDLQEEYLGKIAAITSEISYKKDTVIFEESEPGRAFYYVKSGKVKIFRTNEDGKEHIIHILGEGGVFGEVTLFSDFAYPATAVVYEDSIIGMIQNSHMEKLIKENSELALKLIKILSEKLFYSQEKIRDLAFNDVFSRTAIQLIKLSEEYGRKVEKGVLIDIELSRQELADMVGATRETISRAISKFKREKSIYEHKDKIILTNIEKL